MTYTNISVVTLPTILAGPMVRRVEAGSVSIWLALKEAATVTVTVVKEDGRTTVLSGSSAPLKVGANLYLCTVTLRGSGLEAGCRYLYQVTTQEKDFKTLLGSDAVLTALCYSPNTLPSFYVPPATADGLRIAHGGHRKPHGLGKDALAALDSVIEDSYKTSPPTSAQTHPHQLFFTGNQIYGDEVADALLLLIQDAASALGCTGATAEAGKRADYLQDTMGFPIDRRHKSKVRNHLLTFHEYVLMHLFVWSDVLWPKPTATNEDEPPIRICKLEDYPSAQQGLNAGRYASEVKALELFRQTLQPVRRLLANVPTYMIFDEHDLVYRCYADRQWCEDVLPDDPGDGLEKLEKRKRLLKDAFKAYALCQGWGNDPEQYAFLAQPNPLEALDTRIYLPTLKHPRTGAPSEESWMKWHYDVSGPDWHTVVLDLYTWRVFPDYATDPPGLIGDIGMRHHVETLLQRTIREYRNTKLTFQSIFVTPIPAILTRKNACSEELKSFYQCGSALQILLTNISRAVMPEEVVNGLNQYSNSEYVMWQYYSSTIHLLTSSLYSPTSTTLLHRLNTVNVDGIRTRRISRVVQLVSGGVRIGYGVGSLVTEMGHSRQIVSYNPSTEHGENLPKTIQQFCGDEEPIFLPMRCHTIFDYYHDDHVKNTVTSPVPTWELELSPLQDEWPAGVSRNCNSVMLYQLISLGTTSHA